MPTYSYTIAEYDPVKTWLVLGPVRRMSVELDDDEDFMVWAMRAWPQPRYRVDPVPELPPWKPSA